MSSTPVAPGAISPSEVTIAIIAKEPVAGRVKTRLCPPCTPDEAAGLAAAALEDTMDVACRVAAGRRVLVLDGNAGDWVPVGFDVVSQHGGPFDERLANAAADVGGPIVIVGMDTPQLGVDLLSEVVTNLCKPGCDAVLGFANDGGYWVIALREPLDDVFTGVPMSTSVTGTLQHERLLTLGLSTHIVAGLTDVDTFDEALTVAAEAPRTRFAAAVADVGRGSSPGPTERATPAT